jgi:hypothetical protein
MRSSTCTQGKSQEGRVDHRNLHVEVEEGRRFKCEGKR